MAAAEPVSNAPPAEQPEQAAAGEEAAPAEQVIVAAQPNCHPAEAPAARPDELGPREAQQRECHGGTSDLQEECESLRERCEALEERNVRLLDEIAILRGRSEVDIPHWAHKARVCADNMAEIIRPMMSVPIGQKLQIISDGLYEVETGLRGLGGAPLREELQELRQQFAKQLNEAQRRDAEMQDENDRLRMMLQAVGVSVSGGSSAPATPTKGVTIAAGTGATTNAAQVHQKPPTPKYDGRGLGLEIPDDDI